MLRSRPAKVCATMIGGICLLVLNSYHSHSKPFLSTFILHITKTTYTRLIERTLFYSLCSHWDVSVKGYFILRFRYLIWLLSSLLFVSSLSALLILSPMDDLLDLDWSNKPSSSPQHSQATPSRVSAGPKDAFADLLSFGSSSSSPPPSLNQQRFQQQQQQQQKYHQAITASPMSRYSSTSSSTSSPAAPSQTPSSAVPLAPSPLLPRNTPRTNTLDDLLDPFGKTKQTSTSNVPLNAL